MYNRLIDNGLLWPASTSDPSGGTAASTKGLKEILSEGSCHEFFPSHEIAETGCNPISPILPLLSTLLASHPELQSKLIVFIGNKNWPTPFALRDAFIRSNPQQQYLFIHCRSENQKAKALESVVSSRQVMAVFISCKSLSFAFTQKLALLTKAHGVKLFLFRGINDLRYKSAAHSRWRIQATISPTEYPAWRFTLEHLKGSYTQDNEWLLEGINEEEVSLHLLSTMVGQSDSAQVARARCA